MKDFNQPGQDTTILSKAAEVIVSKPVTATLPLKNLSSLDRLLIALKLKSKERSFIIKPLLVGSRYRIASVVVKLPDDILGNYGNGGLITALMNPGYVKDIIYIVAVGLQNNADEPAEDLISFIQTQCDDTDISKLLDIIFSLIPVRDFIKSIILIKGADILKSA